MKIFDRCLIFSGLQMQVGILKRRKNSWSRMRFTLPIRSVQLILSCCLKCWLYPWKLDAAKTNLERQLISDIRLVLGLSFPGGIFFAEYGRTLVPVFIQFGSKCFNVAILFANKVIPWNKILLLFIKVFACD